MRLGMFLFLAVATVVLAPFEITHQLASTSLIHQVAAGELIDGSHLMQSGHTPSATELGPAERSLCVGVQLATYLRTNRGKLGISWRQGASYDHWYLASSRIKDNQFSYFCPKEGIAPDADFVIDIIDVGSKSGHGPTAWLTADTKFGTVMVNGLSRHASLSLSFATHREVSLRQIMSLDEGAYLFGWLMSVTIGLAGIFLMRNSRTQRISF